MVPGQFAQAYTPWIPMLICRVGGGGGEVAGEGPVTPSLSTSKTCKNPRLPHTF